MTRSIRAPLDVDVQNDFCEGGSPVHCVQGTEGAEYAPGFDTTSVDGHVRKGQGAPAYSFGVRLLDGLHVGVAPDTVTRALEEMRAAGVEVTA